MEGYTTVSLTILGNPATKKNGSQIVLIAGRPRLVPSKAYKKYEKLFLPQVPPSLKKRIAYPVTLKCVYYMPTKRLVDLTNLLAASCDILVKAGVLADDNSNIVVSHDGSRVLYDKENPRVEIEIIPIARRVE